MQTWYAVHDISVVVHSDSKLLLRIIEEVIAYYGFEPSGTHVEEAVVLEVSLDSTIPSIPASAHKISDFEYDIEAWRDRNSIILRDESCAAWLQPESGRGTIYFDSTLEQKQSLLHRKVLLWLILSQVALFRRRQAFLIHCAAVVRNDRGILFVADSDSGKSTLAYSLVRQGWQYVSDDSVLLRAEEARIAALAFRRSFALDVEARQYFPEMHLEWNRPFTDSDKLCVPMETLFPALFSPHCVPEILIFPKIENLSDTRLIPISKSRAMGRVLAQSALVTLEPELTPFHLEVIKGLINQTQHYELQLGRDLKEEPARIAEIVEQIINTSVPENPAVYIS